MARLKSQSRVESLRVDAGVMREQFDQLAAPGARFRDGPLHHALSDAAAAAMSGDANILDQAARGALRTQPRQDAELQATDDGACTILCYHKLDVRIAGERFEGAEIRRRQRVFEAFACAAERIVRQHRHDDTDVVAARAPDGNREIPGHDIPVELIAPAAV